MYIANWYPYSRRTCECRMAQYTIGTAQPDYDAVSQRVVDAVAAARDVDPLDVQPLYDVIDPDALEQLFTATHSSGRTDPARVVFTLDGCEVTVHSDGTIDVSAPNDRPAATPADRAIGQDEV